MDRRAFERAIVRIHPLIARVRDPRPQRHGDVGLWWGGGGKKLSTMWEEAWNECVRGAWMH